MDGPTETEAMGVSGKEGAWLPRITLPQHGLTRYLRVRLEVAAGVLRWEIPRTLLGLVPLGTRHLAVPVIEIRSATMRKVVVHPLRLFVGMACLVAPWFLAPWWVSVPALVLGLWVLLVSFGPHLEVVSHTSARHRAGICFGHQLDGEVFAEAVNGLARGAP